MKAIKRFFEHYRIMFFIALFMNIIFLVVEVINFISSFSALAIFTIILYASSIVYMILMEVFEIRHKSDDRYGYIFTFWFLLINAITLPFTIIAANVFDYLSPIYTLSKVFPHFSIFIIFFLYFAYLIYKIVKPIFKSLKAKNKKDGYTRSGTFGDIIAAVMNLITSLSGSFLAVSAAMFFETAPGVMVNSVPFILGTLAVLVVSIIFLVKCGNAMRRLKKEGSSKQPSSIEQ